MSSRDDLIRNYLDYAALADEMYECDKRKIRRKTTSVTKTKEGTVTQVVVDELEFS